MLLIGGVEVLKEDLPNSDFLDYLIEPNRDHLEIKLRTVAKSVSCYKVYLPESLSDLTLLDEVKEKTEYFKDLDDLKTKLKKLGEENSESNEGESFGDLNFSEVQISSVEERNLDDINGEETDIVEIDNTLPEEILEIPEISENVDDLKLLLETKDRIIEQREIQIKELIANRDDIIRLQEQRMMEMKKEFEEKIMKANEIIESLKRKVEEVSLDPELGSFLRFANYSKAYKAALRDGLFEDEKQELGVRTSSIYIFACGAGDSLYRMLHNVANLVDKKTKALIVDFTGDPFLINRFKLSVNKSSIMLREDDVPLEELIKKVDGVDIIPSLAYNDIALLAINWGKVLRKLMNYAKGRSIILLFNNINSFCVKYTISRLATIGTLFIFVKCNPVILVSLYSEAKFIPRERVNIIALDYIDKVKNFLEDILMKLYPVIPFSKDQEIIDWNRLKLKV